jgi:hypothetical protein
MTECKRNPERNKYPTGHLGILLSDAGLGLPEHIRQAALALVQANE